MGMNRRDFIKSGARLCGASLIGGLSAPPLFGAEGPKLVVGIVSDIHVTGPGTEAPLRKILNYFKSRDVDAVLMPGDLTDHGILDEMQRVRRTWDEVFPDGCGLNGKPVMRLAVSGNHEFEGSKYYGIPKDPVLAEQAKAARADPLGNEKSVWEKAWGESYERLKTWNVKGYVFVGAHFEGYGGAEGLDSYLKGVALPKDRPFFYFEHMQPNMTCGSYGAKKPGFAGRNTRPVLNAYPNAVALAGHTHDSLTFEQSIWQDEFLSVNCSSAHFISSPDGRENSFYHPGTPRYMTSQMPITDMWGMKNALVMNVFDDRIVFERREFCRADGERLAADWVVPLSGKKVYGFEDRAKVNRAGAFPNGSKLTVGPWKTGKSRAKVETEQLTVGFPVAVAPEGYRVFDYAVTAIAADGSVKCRKLVYNNHCAVPLADEDKTMTCVFSRAELGTELLRFEVRARDSFGNESVPLVSGND